MIRVTKPRRKIPAEWINAAEVERNAAVKHFTNKRTRKKPFVKGKTSLFKAYGDVKLRAVLNDLYFFKCAYCEAHYGRTQPVAIEHYRPKSEVSDGKTRIRPGYYWLAADWDNLFPSCTDCNSRRGHPLPDGTTLMVGKGNEFPLEPSCKRATKPGEEAKEKPLLLNPAIDHPDRYLAYRQEDKDVVVDPIENAHAKPNPRGRTSIDIYGLNRPQLAKARGDHARRLLLQLRYVEDAYAAKKLNPKSPAATAAFEDEARQLRDAYLQDGHEFLGMCRQLIYARLPELKGLL